MGLLGIGIIGYVVVQNMHQLAIEHDVKTELIKQNGAMQASVVAKVYKQTLPVSVKSTDKVTITISVSLSGTSYCIAATSIADAKVTYHMNETTPVDTPVKGSCLDDVTTVPSTPGDVSVASTSATAITIQWAATPYAATYNVQCAKDVSFVNGLQFGSSSSLNATVDKLDGDTQYYCRVAAANKAGQSTWSQTVQAQTNLYSQPPKNMKATIISSTELGYSWDAVPGARYYNVQYTTDIDFVTDVTTLRVDTASGSIKGLKPYTGYFFRSEAVTASFDATHAAYSDPAFARTTK
jgi:hypothetical protein